MRTEQRDMCASMHSAVYVVFLCMSSAVVYILHYSCVLVTVLGRMFQHPGSPGVVGMDGRTRATSLTGKML